MNAVRKRSLGRSRRIVLFLLSAAALALTFTPLASAQTVDVGGSAAGTGTFGFAGGDPTRFTLTLDVAGTPLGATGPVTFTDTEGTSFTGVARCIAIDETATGFRASIAGEITVGNPAVRGFLFTVYDNTPSGQIDQVSNVGQAGAVQTSCAFDREPLFTLTAGDYTVAPAGACPPGDDEDNDGLTDDRESLFSTLLGNADSDLDGIADGNDDANGNGEDDEDEDDEDDECPDQDSDDDEEDDEDEDDDDEDDD
jgi:hypothetical protein